MGGHGLGQCGERHREGKGGQARARGLDSPRNVEHSQRQWVPWALLGGLKEAMGESETPGHGDEVDLGEAEPQSAKRGAG